MRLRIPYTDQQSPITLVILIWLYAGLGFLPLTGHAQIDTTDFFPVREGNVWVYEACENGNCEFDDKRVEIVDTTRTDSGSIMVEFDQTLFASNVIGNKFKKKPNANVLLDDIFTDTDTLSLVFKADAGIDTVWFIDNTTKVRVDTIKPVILFGMQTLQKETNANETTEILLKNNNTTPNSDSSGTYNNWTGGIGITTMNLGTHEPTYIIKGAYINGVLLGDTTVV